MPKSPQRCKHYKAHDMGWFNRASGPQREIIDDIHYSVQAVTY